MNRKKLVAIRALLTLLALANLLVLLARAPRESAAEMPTTLAAISRVVREAWTARSPTICCPTLP